MMATTHVLVGTVFGIAMWALVPGVRILPMLTATFGDLFPDFDLYAGHRKTLHSPAYFSTLAVPAVVAVALNPTTTVLAVVLLLAATALHSTSDVLGGGPELKPWLGTSERVVYDRWNGRWLAPKRLIRYDGTSEDLALTFAFAAPPALAFDGLVKTLAIGAAAVSGVYVLFRKPTVAIAETVVAAIPDHIANLMPERFVRDFR